MGKGTVFTVADAQRMNNQLTGYVKIKVDVQAALGLAGMTPRPDYVRSTIMKAVANNGYVTLEQIRAVIGHSAKHGLTR